MEPPGPLKEYALRGAERPGDMVTVLEGKVESLPLGEEIDRLFADEWARGSIFVDFLEASGATEIEVGPWLPGDAGGASGPGRRGVREVHCRVPAPRIPLCPTSTRISLTYTLAMLTDDLGQESLQVDVTSVVHDVPYCDHFIVQDRTVMMNLGDSTVVSKAVSVLFVKSTMLQSKIAFSTVAEQRKAGEAFLELLRQRRRAHQDVSKVPRPLTRRLRLPSPSTRAGSAQAEAVRQIRQQRFRKGAPELAAPSRRSSAWDRLLLALVLLLVAAAAASLAGDPSSELKVASPSQEALTNPSCNLSPAPWSLLQAGLFAISAACLCFYPCGLLLYSIRGAQAAAPAPGRRTAAKKLQ